MSFYLELKFFLSCLKSLLCLNFSVFVISKNVPLLAILMIMAFLYCFMCPVVLHFVCDLVNGWCALGGKAFAVFHYALLTFISTALVLFRIIFKHLSDNTKVILSEIFLWFVILPLFCSCLCNYFRERLFYISLPGILSITIFLPLYHCHN